MSQITRDGESPHGHTVGWFLLFSLKQTNRLLQIFFPFGCCNAAALYGRVYCSLCHSKQNPLGSRPLRRSKGFFSLLGSESVTSHRFYRTVSHYEFPYLFKFHYRKGTTHLGSIYPLDNFLSVLGSCQLYHVYFWEGASKRTIEPHYMNTKLGINRKQEEER